MSSTTEPTSPDIFEIPNKARLDQFETDFVAAELPSSYEDPYSQWETRMPLSRLVIPNRFYGSLVNILAVPYEDAFDSFTKSHHSTMPVHVIDKEHRAAHTVGFRVLADMKSTGRGIIGSLDISVWVWQRTDEEDPYGARRNELGEYGRYVEKPTRKNQQCVDDLIKTSTKIGLTILRNSIRHPYLGGFEGRRTYKKR